MRRLILAGTAASLILIGMPPSAAAPEPSQERVKRGEYLVAIMDCTGCHTPGAMVGQPDQARFLGGSGVGFQLPGFGIVYPPNLTPDPETGLGRWSAAEIITAVRTGVRPDGRVLAPVMPYHSYGRLTDADAQALAAYLKTLTPVRHQVPPLTGPTEKPTAPYLTVVTP